MSKRISFDLHFPTEIWPGSVLLKLLRSDFCNFLDPKMGKIKVGDKILEFGPHPYEMVYETMPLLEGEEVVVPGTTTFTGHLNVSQEIVGFLAQFQTHSWSVAEFVGNCQLDCIKGNNIAKEWLFRSGHDVWRRPIIWFRISNFLGITHVGINITCPWFFLKNWWPEDIPHSSTSETAECNWIRLVNFVHLVVTAWGEDRLDEIVLEFEGSAPFQEREWLIKYAQQLPKLKVDFA